MVDFVSSKLIGALTVKFALWMDTVRCIWIVFFLLLQLKEMVVALLNESNLSLANDVIETIVDNVWILMYSIMVLYFGEAFCSIGSLSMIFFVDI